MACVINGVRPILLLTGTSSSNLRALYPARLCVAGTERGAVKCDSSPCLQSATRFFKSFQQLCAVTVTQHRTPRDSNSKGVLIPAGTLRKALTPHTGDVEVKPLVRHPRSLTA